jgi:hypothetical protein
VGKNNCNIGEFLLAKNTIGRILSCTPANVLNRVMRFSRQTAAVGAEILSQVTLEEDLVIDGFESYVESK